MATHIPFIKPKLPKPNDLLKDIQRIYRNNYYTNNGPIHDEFKNKLEKYLGQGIHAVIVSNATLALMLTVREVIGTGKKSSEKYVAIPSFTFPAGPLAIRWCGYEPVFFDISNETLQPSLTSFSDLLNRYGDDLAGVVLTNSFGIGNDEIEQWNSLLEKNELPFLIDSAPGFGSTYANSQLLGSESQCEIFSFHVTKPFGIGEGGLITTKNAKLAARLESLKNFGFNEDKQTIGLGMNAKITELDCAIGLRILENYPETLADRRKTYAYYVDCLTASGIKFLPRAETAAIQFASIMVDTKVHERVLNDLKTGGVEVRNYYAPGVHHSPFFADAPKVELTVTDKISKQIISLPVHPNMDSKTVEYISQLVNRSVLK